MNKSVKWVVFFLITVSLLILIANRGPKNTFYISDKNPGTDLSHHFEKTAPFRLHFIDVGQGDAILIQSDYKNILIDAGDRGSGVTNALWGRGVDTLHWVIGTHPHADHIGGLIDVFRNIPVQRVMDAGITHTSITYQEYISVIDSIGAEHLKGFRGMTQNVCSNLYLRILHPDTASNYSLNNSSLVLQIKMNEVFVLITGDIEHIAEHQIILNNETFESHILKVAHHGSQTSSHQSFLAAVNPEIAVIMVGAENRYGHPSQSVLQRITSTGVDVYRTDLHGDILILSDGFKFEVLTESRKEETNFSFYLPIDINSAGFNELQQIIHIGPARAKEIIEKRPFGSLEELDAIRGISSRHIADIKQQNMAVIYPL